MNYRTIFLCLLSLIFFASAFAWTNPSGNPPTGGGAIQADSSGNVGIGGAPTAGIKLHIVGGALRIDNNRQLIFRGSGVNDGGFLVDGSNNLAWKNPNDGLNIFYINSGGNVGIGAAPIERLDVNGEILLGPTASAQRGGLENDNNDTFVLHNVNYTGVYNRRDTAGGGAPSAILRIGENGLAYHYESAGIGSFTPQYDLFRITTAGNVGIGTNAPADKFVVVGSAGSVTLPGTGDIISFTKNGANYISTPGLAASLVFKTGGSDRVAVTSAGNLDLYLNKIINLATPTANSDAATKKYVDDKTTAPNNTRLWGAGRPGVATYDSTGAIDNNTGECDSADGLLRIGRGNVSVDWANSASGCAAGQWVCTEAEISNKGALGDCANYNKHYRNCADGTGSPAPEVGETDLAWVANRGNDGPNINAGEVDDGTYWGRAVVRSSNSVAVDIPICRQMPVWCCAYK